MSTPVTMVQLSNDDDDSPSLALIEPLLNSSESDDLPPGSTNNDPNHSLRDSQSGVLVDPLVLDESSWEHGQVQVPSCRNWIWALLFLFQLAVTLTLAIMAIVTLAKGEYHLPDSITWDFPVAYSFLFLVVTILSIAILSALVILLLLGPLADMMIQLSLVISPISCGLMSLASLMVGQIGASLLFALFAALGICYAVSIWHRIPMATANLAVALAAIHANKGLLGMAYLATILDTLWTLLWTLALVQVSALHYGWIMDCNNVTGTGRSDDADDECHLTARGKWILVALLFSLYWTCQVISNVFHTTVVGVVGTFWFSPPGETRGCCNMTIYDSWVRSSVYSFGTICLGSLLVAVLQVLQFLVKCGRQQNEDNNRNRRQHGSILWCLLDFIVDQLERLLEYINAWAFVYVGLYGYEYWTASHKVYQLFRARGWSVILNDHLISRSFRLMQFVIGLLSGAMAVVLGLAFFGFHLHPLATFILGIFLGTRLSSIQFQVVTSAVETVVVCFAEAPSALIENHPSELSSRMIRSWRAAYPNECGF